MNNNLYADKSGPLWDILLFVILKRIKHYFTFALSPIKNPVFIVCLRKKSNVAVTKAADCFCVSLCVCRLTSWQPLRRAWATWPAACRASPWPLNKRYKSLVLDISNTLHMSSTVKGLQGGEIIRNRQRFDTGIVESDNVEISRLMDIFIREVQFLTHEKVFYWSLHFHRFSVKKAQLLPKSFSNFATIVILLFDLLKL